MSASLAETELRSYFHFLAFDEIAKSRTLKKSADRERFLTARLLLRLALSRMAEDRLHPSAWRFTTGRFGKPEMSPGLPQIHFNVSHAAEMVAVAIDPAAPVGVDIERVDGFSAEMPESVLAPRERLLLDRCDQQARSREFLTLWTLKEAHAKRLGLGVHLDFTTFAIDWKPGSDSQEIEALDERLATRVTRMNGATYQVSLAHEANRRSVAWHDVDIGKFVRPLM